MAKPLKILLISITAAASLLVLSGLVFLSLPAGKRLISIKACVSTITRDGKMPEAWATSVCECGITRIDAGVDQKVAIQACVKAHDAAQQDKPAADAEATGR